MQSDRIRHEFFDSLFSVDSPGAFDFRSTIESSFILPGKSVVFIFATAFWITFDIISYLRRLLKAMVSNNNIR